MLTSLKAWVAAISEKLSALFERETKKPSLLNIVDTYFEMRKDARYDWGRYAQQKGAVVDLKQYARIYNWMQASGITTLEDFHAMLEAQQPVIDKIKANEKRIKRLETGIGYIDISSRLKPIADKSQRGFKTSREKYAEEHKEELEQFNKAVRYLKANGLNADDRQKLLAEVKALKTENQKLQAKMRSANIDPEMIRQIRYCVDAVLHEAEIPEKKDSVLAKLKNYQTTDRSTQKKRDGPSL